MESIAASFNRAKDAARKAGESDGRGGGKKRADGTVGPYEILSNVSARECYSSLLPECPPTCLDAVLCHAVASVSWVSWLCLVILFTNGSV